MYKYDTRAVIIIKFAGFPHGKIMNCYMWFAGSIYENEIRHRLKDLKINTEEKYFITSIEVKNILFTSKSKDVKYEELILVKEVDVAPKTKVVTKDVEKIVVPDVLNVDLCHYDDEELDGLLDRISEEFFKREHELSDDEYSFYLENKKIIRLEDVKKTFQEIKGDAYKFKKMKIRETLENKNLIEKQPV